MKLSQQCSKNINHLADSIARLVARYPSQSQYMHAFFRKHYERLKSQSDDIATQYDLEFINQLGDVQKVPEHTRESIAALIDSRLANNSDWLQGQIDSRPANNSDWLQGQIDSRPANNSDWLQGQIDSRPANNSDWLQGQIDSRPANNSDWLQGQIDSRPANNSDWLQGQIDELFKEQGYSDRELFNQIKNLVQSKPEKAVALMDKTLNMCENLIGQLTCFTRMSS